MAVGCVSRGLGVVRGAVKSDDHWESRNKLNKMNIVPQHLHKANFSHGHGLVMDIGLERRLQ